MSVGASPSTHRGQGRTYRIAASCRARHLVATLGGRFSLELGIDVDRGAEEIERWALVATLFGNRISTSVAMRTYRVLERAGVRTIADAGERDHEELVALLDEGGYVRYDERTASRLLALAETIADRYDGRIAVLGDRIVATDELERALGALPGWGPVTTRAFLRELRGVWPGAEVPLGDRAAAAAHHLQLPAGSEALSAVAAAAHLDLRDLEAALVRLALCHDLAGCPGGEECPFAAFDRDQLVHY
ncbi:MAG TPA: hypothetical protein VI409_12165 [Gaiellaceae bacterium]|nr:hypothetical protein [Gaiellaceae bacterium]